MPELMIFAEVKEPGFSVDDYKKKTESAKDSPTQEKEDSKKRQKVSKAKSKDSWTDSSEANRLFVLAFLSPTFSAIDLYS